MVIGLWKYRRLVLYNSVGDLRNRYRGSVAGYLWNVFVPLAQIIVFSTIFAALMGWDLPNLRKLPIKGGLSYVVFLCSGLLPWNTFADTLMRGVSSLVGNAGYLKKLPLPEQLFVAQDACSGFLSGLLSVAIFLVFSIVIAGYGPYWEWVQILPGMILLTGFAFGLGLVLSCVNVFFRDVHPLTQVVVLLWFWLTPVVYMEESFQRPGKEWVLSVLAFNPMYHFVTIFHEGVFMHNWVSAHTWIICGVATATVNGVAHAVLWRLRADIRDAL
jgi:ABC-type polysaccharide/polyol phosphate export permease